jgi:hypothetical protein
VTNIEAAIQKQLDDNPAWHHGRLVLADHLDDIGDPRAEGYRILGRRGLYPYFEEKPARWGVGLEWFSWGWLRPDNNEDGARSPEVYDKLEPPHCRLPLVISNRLAKRPYGQAFVGKTRVQMEDRVIEIIMRLRPSSRAELLAVTASPV